MSQQQQFQVEQENSEQLQISAREMRRIAAIVRLLTRVDINELTEDEESCPSCVLPYLGQDGAEPGNNPEGFALCCAIRLPCGHIWGDGCIERWFASGHNTCPMCRRNYSNVLSDTSNEVTSLDAESADFRFLFNLIAGRRIRYAAENNTIVLEGVIFAVGSDGFTWRRIEPALQNAAENNTVVLDGVMFGSDRFTLGMTEPALQNAEWMAEDIINHANTHYPILGHPFSQLLHYEVRGPNRDAIARELYRELLVENDLARQLHEFEALEGEDVVGHVVFRRPVRQHLEVVEVYPPTPEVIPHPPSMELLQLLTGHIVTDLIVNNNTNVFFGDDVIIRENYFPRRHDAVRAFIRLINHRIRFGNLNYICALRNVITGNPFSGTILFIIGSTDLPPPSWYPPEDDNLGGDSSPAHSSISSTSEGEWDNGPTGTLPPVTSRRRSQRPSRRPPAAPARSPSLSTAGATNESSRPTTRQSLIHRLRRRRLRANRRRASSSLRIEGASQNDTEGASQNDTEAPQRVIRCSFRYQEPSRRFSRFGSHHRHSDEALGDNATPSIYLAKRMHVLLRCQLYALIEI
ncbi:hypothetical protein HYFRA_00013286 [Hymenoscyphus fraxineus]|uniref:RING-type domain-containing protein n=1 Tax=Hymenoscyphus fraxineus TaxID=746836 RepID=A0A9N9LBK5_9HELO|nr:hypothetical protein HYFRA_00013286 [Hymenoscyphus fraxineus]